MMSKQQDRAYLEILIRAIRVCSTYRPKFGHGKKDGYSLNDFQKIYHNDPFYNWMGLDDPLMYAAHKAAGGMTSIYRQIGIGCETLFRNILRDSLQLTDDEVKWSYAVAKAGGKTRTLSLDARIPLDSLRDEKSKKRVQQWIKDAAASLDIESTVLKSIRGIVFEVRQGYKSKDSKRQNADITNAATAYTKGYLPCVAVMSAQIDEDISIRYKTEKWILLTGAKTKSSSIDSVYSFMHDVVGYDLASFFERNRSHLRKEVHQVLQRLLLTK